MAETELIDQLIDAYHSLNMRVRTVPEERLREKASDGSSVESLVRGMRDDELRFSAALKERLTGQAMPEVFDSSAAPMIGTETDRDTPLMLISQFGSAREVTLSLTRALPEAEWDQTSAGGKTIRASVSELIANDQRRLTRIAELVKYAAPV